jgi:hypothetical protein
MWKWVVLTLHPKVNSHGGRVGQPLDFLLAQHLWLWGWLWGIKFFVFKLYSLSHGIALPVQSV